MGIYGSSDIKLKIFPLNFMGIYGSSESSSYLSNLNLFWFYKKMHTRDLFCCYL